MEDSNIELTNFEKEHPLFNILWSILTSQGFIDPKKPYFYVSIWMQTEEYFGYIPLFDDGESWISTCNEMAFRAGFLKGMDKEILPLVAAVAYIRIMAAGEEAFIGWRNVWLAIMQSMDTNPVWKPLFGKYCQAIEREIRSITHIHEDLSEHMRRTKKVLWITASVPSGQEE